MNVLRAALADRDAAWRIVTEYYEAIGVVLREDREVFDEFLSGRGRFWLASANGETAGCIALRPLPEHEGACEIKRLYVRPLFRGLGLAHALLSAAEDYALDAGYDAIYLDTFDALTVATQFYLRAGYEPTERYNDNPQATIFMKKTLR